MTDSLALSSTTPTKTFVVEAHTPDPAAYLEDMVGKRFVETTDDAYLSLLHLTDGSFWVDQLDERFWSFHTDMPTLAATSFLQEKVSSRHELDWMWLPSGHLRQLWPGTHLNRVHTDFRGAALVSKDAPARDLRIQLSGREAEELLNYISSNPRYRSTVTFDRVQATLVNEDLGIVSEAVTRNGRFLASGESVDFHLQFVRRIVERYRQFVTLCESHAIRWTGFDEPAERGGRVEGGPLVIRFNRPIDDLATFLDTLFSSRVPFRLWGEPEIVDDVAEVDAVDLHVGQRLRVDVGTNWLRIYLDEGTCGNTVARLVTNLQHRFDGALWLADPALESASGGQYMPALAS